MAIAPVAIGDIVQVIIGSRVLGQSCLNVLYYRADSNMGPNTYQATLQNLSNKIATDIVQGIIPYMLDAMGNNTTVEFIQLQKVYPQREIPVRTPQGVPGVHVDDCATPNVAGVILKRVEKPGRGKTGSFHLAGIPETGYSGGSFTAPYQALLDAIGNQLDDPIDGIVAGSKWNPGTFNPDLGLPDNFVPLAGYEVKTTVRVMRRRTVGVGI
jgi:hypothetical protein